jgi:ribonuclease HII
MEELSWEDDASAALSLCGIDEAGRGPLAGPVCAAAVILPADFPREILADSKVLSARKREYAAAIIRELARGWAIGWATAIEIDEINILQATMMAMARAYSAMGMAADLVLVDGNRTPTLPVRARAIVRGDSKVPEIMAASILAKTSRDRVMERYDWLYPEYGYARHKGYPTAAHREACIELGPSPIQRLTFTVRPPQRK